LDECRFIGFWIADGSVTHLLRGGREYTLAQSFAYPNIIKWVDELLHRMGISNKRKIIKPATKTTNKSVKWSIPRGTGWGCQHRIGVFAIEPYLKKEGSELFWGFNESQFDAFIEGFWYGDGNHHQAKNGFPGSIYINNMNRTLINLIQAIGVVRRWRCRVSTIPQKNPRYKTQYGIKMIKGAVQLTTTKKTKIEHEDFKPETVWCVRTTSKNIITRRNGRVAVMGNTEGYDEPSVDCIVILRATKVRALFCQMVGRGTRLSPATGKENLLLLDFLWMTATHDLCRPACLLSEDAEVCKTITKRQEKCTNAEDSLEINEETLESAQTETVKKREDSLAKKLREQSRKKGKLVDPLQYAAAVGAVDLKKSIPNGLDESHRPTMEQLDRLEKLGFACPGSFSAADKLLTVYQQRVDNKLSTPKQIKFLTSRGFKNVANWSMEDARKMVNRYAACGWNRNPQGVNPETYQP
jgi:hypothetical protein